MRHRCTGALLLAAVLAAVGLAACGGGGSSASTPAAAVSSTASTPAPAVTATTPATTATATAPTATAKPAERAPRPSTTSTSNSSSSSGPAASFRTPGGDNSIPDYGNEAPPTERQRATAALAAFLRARANGEWSKACTYLAGTTRSQLERLAGASKGRVSGCGPILAALSKGPASTRADTLTAGVASLRIKGNSAFALYHGPKGSKYVMPLRNEGGAWKVSELAPIAYPLGSAGAAP